MISMSGGKEMRKSIVNMKECVACGSCLKVCRKDAIHIDRGQYATVDESKCVGCGLCAKICPASCIEIQEVKQHG